MKNQKKFRLGQDRLDIETLVSLGKSIDPPVEVTVEAWNNLEKFKSSIDLALASGKKIYGVNTGFGFLSQVTIATQEINQLQTNLVRSHACGVGDILDLPLARSLLVLRAHTLLLGHSGVRRNIIELILRMLEFDIMPVIPLQGSVGASGDLAPLAHLALSLLGEGSVFFRGKKLPAKEVFSQFALNPIKLEAKEGLALINGTHFMTNLAAWATLEGFVIARSADLAACLSLDACRGTLVPFDARIHQLRPHKGQGLVAENIRNVFASGKDEILDSHVDCGKVQDPYSLRCVPQVHGASRDVFDHVRSIIEIELNSITDNPLIFEGGDFLSGGNFHGQPIAMAMDYLAIGIAELGSISERRTEKLTNPHQSGLPAFVAQDSGLNSGFMIPHVVAASLVSENKVLCHPASVDSIPTSADKEDHVSMGPIAAKKARQVIQNCRRILAIEFLAASQGLSFLRPLKPNPGLQSLLNDIREIAPEMEIDRSLAEEIEHVAEWIREDGPYHSLNKAGVSIL